VTHDPLTAVLQQLADHHDQLTRLDAREDQHHADHTTQLASLTSLATEISQTLRDHQAVLTRLDGSDSQHQESSGGYRPKPAAAWWELTPADRQEPVARLAGWIEQIYRPGYGHLAAALAPCWPAHDLCLYGLDILAELWSVLYLQPDRTPGTLSAQAEYQARILPALAAQLVTETSRCGHTRSRIPGPGWGSAR
jgi:hypothetical protein